MNLFNFHKSKNLKYKTINENTIQIPTKLPIILSFNDLGLKIFWKQYLRKPNNIK